MTPPHGQHLPQADRVTGLLRHPREGLEEDVALGMAATEPVQPARQETDRRLKSGPAFGLHQGGGELGADIAGDIRLVGGGAAGFMNEISEIDRLVQSAGADQREQEMQLSKTRVVLRACRSATSESAAQRASPESMPAWRRRHNIEAALAKSRKSPSRSPATSRS